MSTQNKNSDLLGILCMCIGVFFLTISDSLAKWFNDSYSPIQLIFIRAIISFPLLGAAALLMGKRQSLKTSQLGLHMFRGVISVVSACSYYLGIRLLPFADVTAIGYASPLFVALLTTTVFKEKINTKTLIVILIGFLGVIVFARPGNHGLQPAIIFPLSTAFGYAVMMLSAKRMKGGDLISIMFFLALAQLVFSAIAVPWFWQPTQPEHYISFIAMAIFSALGLGLITQAFRIAPAAVVAPYDYTAIIWAILIGYIIWGERPDIYSYIGVFLITACGLYIIFERVRLIKKYQMIKKHNQKNQSHH